MITPYKIALIAGLTLLSTNSLALDTTMHGYISQTYMYTPDNPYYHSETGGHFEFREAGITVATKINEKLRVAGALTYRNAGGFTEDDVRLDFLLLDYQFLSLPEHTMGLRLGRVKNEYGLYNSTRDTPQTRTSIFVPQSVYYEVFREPFLSVDGGSLYYSQESSLGFLTLDLFTGLSHFENSAGEYVLTQQNIPGKFDEVDFDGLKLGWHPNVLPNLSLMATVGRMQLEFDDVPTLSNEQTFAALLDILAVPTHAFRYITTLEIDALLQLLSVQYQWGEWTVTAEFQQIDIDLNNLSLLNIPIPDDGFVSQSYYLQAEWQAFEQVSLFGRYEEMYFDKSDPDGQAFAQRTGGNPVAQFMKSATVGARWHLSPTMTLGAEYTRNNGAAVINGQEEIDYLKLRRHWDFFTLQATYHF